MSEVPEIDALLNGGKEKKGGARGKYWWSPVPGSLQALVNIARARGERQCGTFTCAVLMITLLFWRWSAHRLWHQGPIMVFAGGGKPTVLPHGFDSVGVRLYDREMEKLRGELLRQEVDRITMPFTGLTLKHPGSQRNWFKYNLDADATRQGRNKLWEPATLANLFRMIGPQTILVDVGTWIGPTILFAAGLGARSYGVEADPSAFAKVSTNIKLNGLNSQVLIQPACVGVENDVTAEMSSFEPGNSCSGLGKVDACVAPTQDGETKPSKVWWKVRCYSLPVLFEHWGLELSTDVVLKIDVESYECNLLPSLVDWLLSPGPLNKPTLHIGMHRNLVACTDEQYSRIYELARAYKYGAWAGQRLDLVGTNQRRSKSTRGMPVEQLSRHEGELVLSDYLPPVSECEEGYNCKGPAFSSVATCVERCGCAWGLDGKEGCFAYYGKDDEMFKGRKEPPDDGKEDEK